VLKVAMPRDAQVLLHHPQNFERFVVSQVMRKYKRDKLFTTAWNKMFEWFHYQAQCCNEGV